MPPALPATVAVTVVSVPVLASAVTIFIALIFNPLAVCLFIAILTVLFVAVFVINTRFPTVVTVSSAPAITVVTTLLSVNV